MTQDIMKDFSKGLRWKRVRQELYVGRSGEPLLRLAQSILGVSAAVAALSLWVVPGSSLGADVFAMKVAVSLAFAMLAAVLLQPGKLGAEPEIHVDFAREQVSVVHVEGGVEFPQRQYRFDELGSMQVRNHRLHLFTPEGVRLAVLDLDPETEQHLTA
ncbi:MAG: hypothetical protein MK180_14520 [Rhodobacteraceae bacterium]|nr:hypothetical protein [Paracoccaceae bacterium]